MHSTVIPIRPVSALAPRAPATPTRVVGDPARTRAVLDALVSAVAQDLGDIGPLPSKTGWRGQFPGVGAIGG